MFDRMKLFDIIKIIGENPNIVEMWKKDRYRAISMAEAKIGKPLSEENKRWLAGIHAESAEELKKAIDALMNVDEGNLPSPDEGESTKK